MPLVERRLFSVHVMKTAGNTVRANLARSYGRPHVYPHGRREEGKGGGIESKVSVARLREAIEAGELHRAYHLHLPWAAHELVPGAQTLAVVRDPIDRAASHLRMVARQLGRAPEEIYDHDHFRRWLFADHQVRVFGLSADELDDWDGVGSVMILARMLFETPAFIQREPVALGPEHLARAKAAVDQLDLVGITEDLDALFDVLERDHGWRIVREERRNVGSGPPVPDALRERLEADNQLDRQLYDHVLARLAARGS